MVVKAVRGRRRYIVFTVPEDVGGRVIAEKLTPLKKNVPDLKIIVGINGKAVIRCAPDEIDAVSEAMSEHFQSESLIASGTLRKIYSIYPDTKVKQNRKHPR